MKRSDEIRLRQSELRQRVNELAGKESITGEEKTELSSRMDELDSSEVQLRAAIHEEDRESRAAGESRADSSGEGAEVRALQEQVRVGAYLSAAASNRAVDGREAELQAHRGLDPQSMPWDALMPREVEERADTAITAPSTGNPINQDEILARVFAQTSAAFLRVAMPRVPVGQPSYPVFATGAAAEMADAAATVDAGAATFTSHVLSPTRLSAAYLFSVEDLATTRGLEPSLRADLRMVMSDQMDVQVLTGNGTAPNVPGFVGGHADGLTVPADVSGGVSGYAAWRSMISGQVDGVYANDTSGVRLLVSPKSFEVADGAFRGTDDPDSGADAIRRLGGGFRVSANLPAVASHNSISIACKGAPTAAQAPVWEGVRLIRDEITRANRGQIRIQALALWNFKITRKAQYAALKAQVTS